MQTKTALQIFSLALFWIGCDAVQPTERKKESSSHLENVSFDLASVSDKTPAPRPAAIEITPANGDVFDDRTDRVSINFSGFTTAAGQAVEVQVLRSADAPVAEANWVTVATATSSTTGTTSNDTTQIFRWSVQATPGDAGTWLDGGLLRYRTVVTDTAGVKTLLPFWDHTSGNCIATAGAKSWKDVVKTCKSAFSPDFGAKLDSTKRAATLVSSSRSPTERFFPNYLSRRGYIEEQETIDYYDRINAPLTLADFADVFGFDSQNLFNTDSSQADALYYNNGDLGIGREIHCRTFQSRNGQDGTACITRNYGVQNDGTTPDFSGNADSAMRDAVDNQGSFAAVCMVKFGTKLGGAPNDVQFMVYDANGNLANRAGLDRVGVANAGQNDPNFGVGSNDAIPNNCLNCHGGNFDRQRSEVIGASFLPYDPEGFLFAERDGFGYEAQEDEFRRLNVMVRNAGATPGTTQFVNGMYSDKADVKGTKANFAWAPPGWSGTPEAKTVYRELYKSYCRTCHTSQIGDFAFMTYEDFKGEASKSMNSACATNEMPVAEATMNLFWRSPGRAYLLNSLDGASACSADGDRNGGNQ